MIKMLNPSSVDHSKERFGSPRSSRELNLEVNSPELLDNLASDFKTMVMLVNFAARHLVVSGFFLVNIMI